MEGMIGQYFPTDASAHGAELDSMTMLVHWLMLVLFVGWGVYFIYVLFRFRAGRNPEADHVGVTGHYSTWSEVGVAVVEAVLLVGFAIPAWAAWVSPHPDDADPLVVRVIGEQFAWNVHYPGPDGDFGGTDVHLVSPANPIGLDPEDPVGADDVVAINQLRLPVDRPITVMLSSKDVIHSFALPVMRVKQDAIPGMEVAVRFTAVKTNGDERWEIACAQLCGLGHYRMRGFLTILEQDAYQTWLDGEVAKKMPEPEPEPESEADGEAAAEAA